MKVNGIKARGYFHHYFPKQDARGWHLYNLAVGIRYFTVGIHWCPHVRESSGGGYHVWLSIPFVSLMLEWNRGAKGEKP